METEVKTIRRRLSMARSVLVLVAAAVTTTASLISAETILYASQQQREFEQSPQTKLQHASEEAVRIRVRPLPPNIRRVWLVTRDDGLRAYRLDFSDGTSEVVDPEQFAELLWTHTEDRRIVFRFLNITSMTGIVWVGLGLLGQVLFTGRMLLQWLISERLQRSVVPVGFWWMSLAGATMLLVYFIWRRDIIGVLGQSAGWIIYIRNLWLIYAERKSRSYTKSESAIVR